MSRGPNFPCRRSAIRRRSHIRDISNMAIASLHQVQLNRVFPIEMRNHLGCARNSLQHSVSHQ